MSFAWLKLKRSKSENFVNQLPFISLFILLLCPLIFALIKISSVSLYEHLQGNPALALSKTPPINASWTWEGMMSGSWQKAFEAKLSADVPARSVFIRFHNQLYYSLFSKSFMYSEALIIGKNNFIFEKKYLEKYCNSSRASYTKARFKQWANELKAIENYFSQQGKYFVFLITPSKASYYPEYLPAQYPCAMRSKRPDYYLAINSLKSAGVRYVDGSAITLKNKEKYGQLLYPRGGTHWSSLAAMLTLEELIKRLRHSESKLPLPNYRYRVDKEPERVDKDLIQLAHLIFPYKDYNVPHITFPSPNFFSHTPLSVAVIGGSFLITLSELMLKSNLVSSVDHFFYFDRAHFDYKQYMPTNSLDGYLDNNNMKNFTAIFNSDIIILEENESLLQSSHINKLVNMLNTTQHANLSYKIYG